jgi:hypothetical protein
MQIVIDQTDFRRLPPEIQVALIQALGGQDGSGGMPAGLAGRPAERLAGRQATASDPGLRWRQPVDLQPDQAVRLVHGLSEDHRRRLELFARKGGRVRMKEMQALFGDPDLRAAAEFQKAMTRRLRRIVHDPEKKAQLIGWDFDATRWDDRKTTIVDGVYFVSDSTAEALQGCLKPRRKATRR